MADTINIRIQGQHGSITEDVEWLDVPPLAILTGVNGTGKSQLLEVLAQSFGLYSPVDPQGGRTFNPPQLGARAVFEGASFNRAEAVYSRSQWRTYLGGSGSSEGQIRDAVKAMHARVKSPPTDGTYDEVITTLKESTSKSIAELASTTTQEFLDSLTPRLLWMSEGRDNLAFLFVAYRVFELRAAEQGFSTERILDLYGEPPWLLMNSILGASGLPLRVTYPGPLVRRDYWELDPLPSFNLALKDIERKSEVPFSGLSSGERVIIATANWLYMASHRRDHPKLFILDEPDAHLHPSLTRRFLNVIQEVFIEDRGCRFIMTTHSPSTLALAPKDSLFEMRRTSPRIVRASSKEALIARLTDGFVAVQEATRTVFVEGPDDPPFFLGIWDVLTDQSVQSRPARLEPYPNLHFVYGHGKTVVNSVVPQIRAQGLTSFFGIIDHDQCNTGADGVHVLRRYAMENYLLDPLCIWFVLNRVGKAPAVPGVNIRPLREPDIALQPVGRLQALADSIFDSMTAQSPPRTLQELEREEVTFVGGLILKYPKWFLEQRGKNVMQLYRDVFGPQYIKRDELIRVHQALGMIPQELLDVFSRIQRGDPSRAPTTLPTDDPLEK